MIQNENTRKFLFGQFIFGLCLFGFLLPNNLKADSKSNEKPKYNLNLYEALQWRCIGPFRGGRSVAVAGHPDLNFTYFMGTTGGGVWKTENGGATWLNVSDSVFQYGSVGAIAIANSDPNVVYVGMGETCLRGNTFVKPHMYWL